jgi:hypothetical protein
MMSIKIEDAKTPLERADALGNLIEQLALAKQMKDDKHFNDTLGQAREHSFELVQMFEGGE